MQFQKYIRKNILRYQTTPSEPNTTPAFHPELYALLNTEVFVPALSFAPFLLYRVSVQFQRIYDSNVRHDICELWLLFYYSWRDWETLFRNPLFAGAGLHSKQEKKGRET